MSDEPQSSVKNFVRWLRKDRALAMAGLHVLDLGCGNGKNSAHFAGLDSSNKIVGIDISETALAYAREHNAGTQQVRYIHQSIGERLPFPDAGFDIALDVTSSNSLNEKERTLFLTETHRVLKPGGYFFVRALCKDADKNAQHLLKHNAGPEKDTYIMPDLGLVERVFSRKDFIETYTATSAGPDQFILLYLEKETHYSKVGDRLYKRHFWVAYLQKGL